ncbi:uncharacterized protein [Solanum lycopersicum]|uniref:uncharacterized protein n=1 Tax=Solanum lycopersicum TaxID=4081 RepID=UPI003748624B
MDGNPTDGRFRPPDQSIGVENVNVQATNIDLTEGTSSSSSYLREEAIQVATVEADMDELRRQVEIRLNTTGTTGEILRMEDQSNLEMVELLAIEEAKSRVMEAAKLHAIEAAKLQALELAKSRADISRLEVSRQQLISRELSQGDTQIQQGLEGGGQNLDSRQETRIGESSLGCESHSQQIDGTKDDAQQEVEKIQRNPNFTKEKEIDQQRNSNSNTDKENKQQNPRSNRVLAPKEAAYTSQNRQSGILSSEIPTSGHNVQGNIVSTQFNPKNDELVNVTDRTNTVSVRNLDYQHNFPKLTSNFDRNLPRIGNEKQDPPSGTNNFPKKDHIPEPAPYTVIQTYADRLRYNQSKRGENIKLTDPEITTKQGLPAVLYVKEEVVKDLASTYLQNTQNLDIGRTEIDYHQIQQQGVEDQQQGIQEEWQTQKRRNNNQQVRFNHDRTVSHQQQSQTGMITIPTKNTYIDLESQDHTPAGDGRDQYNVYQHNQSHGYTEGTHIQKEKRNKQSRVETQVIKDHQADYQLDNQNTAGIVSMLHSPAIPYRDNVGVADGGEVGRCQVAISSQHANYDKGKNKVVEQGTTSYVEKEPPDKQTVNISDQIINKNNNKTQTTTGNEPIDHQQDKNVDEYRAPDSEDEFDVETQSLEEGIEPGEEFTNSDQIHKGPLIQSSNADEIRDVTGKQGLSPRGRKLLKQNKNTSTSKPNTRARSRGI